MQYFILKPESSFSTGCTEYGWAFIGVERFANDHVIAKKREEETIDEVSAPYQAGRPGRDKAENNYDHKSGFVIRWNAGQSAQFSLLRF